MWVKRDDLKTRQYVIPRKLTCSHLKMDVCNTSPLLGWPIFRCYVRVREGNPFWSWENKIPNPTPPTPSPKVMRTRGCSSSHVDFFSNCSDKRPPHVQPLCRVWPWLYHTSGMRWRLVSTDQSFYRWGAVDSREWWGDDVIIMHLYIVSKIWWRYENIWANDYNLHMYIYHIYTIYYILSSR